MGLLKPHGRGRRPVRPNALRQAGAGQEPIVIVIYTLAHALGALRAAAHTARPVILVSATNAGIYAGPGWFRALLDAAAEAVPNADFASFLDCGDRPGAALAAIRAGVGGVIFSGRSDIAARLADIARQHGVHFITQRPAADVDLLDDFFAAEIAIEQRCTDILARGPAKT